VVYEVETIKRQAKLRSVGWSACERRLSLWPTPYASLACDMTSASEVAVAA